MAHDVFTENPTKKPTMFTSILITRHQSSSKFHPTEKRLPILSWSKNIFQRLASYYWKCQKNSRYKLKIQNQQPKENHQNKKKRKPNIIWLKQQQVRKKNIGRIFIKLISKYFPPNQSLSKFWTKIQQNLVILSCKK